MFEANNGSELVDKIYDIKAVVHNRIYSANFSKYGTEVEFITAFNKNVRDVLTEFVFKEPFKPVSLDEKLRRDIASISIEFDLMQEESGENDLDYYYDLYKPTIKKFLGIVPYRARDGMIARIGKDRLSLGLIDYESARKIAKDVFDLYLKRIKQQLQPKKKAEEKKPADKKTEDLLIITG